MGEVTFDDLTEGELGKAAGDILRRFDEKVFLLRGEMGSGKTHFIRAFCRALGAEDEVMSPTFNLVHKYRTRDGEEVFHFDFYRLEEEEEALDMGWEEYIDSGAYCFVEWPEKIRNLLPRKAVHIEMKILDGNRRSICAMNEDL